MKPKLSAEARIITSLPEYEDAFIKYFQNTTNTFMSLNNELLSGIETSYFEGPVRMRTSTDEVFLDKEPVKVEIKFNVPFEVIIKTDVEALMESIDRASESGIRTLGAKLHE
ncbi:MAG: hypothetical protein WDZ91_03485 [Paenibacillaceae bacterium]